MRILQLSKKIPYPLNDGETIAVHALMTALHDLGCQTTLLVMDTPKHSADIAQFPPQYRHYTAIHTVKVDTNIRVKDAFLNLFTKKSYNISRFYNAAFAEKLIELLRTNEFDIVQLETLYLAPYTEIIRQHSRAKIVLRSHNVEYEIWQRVAQNEAFLPKKNYLKLLAKRLKAFEISKINAYDLVVSISERDKIAYQRLGCTRPIVVAPVGVALTTPAPPLLPIDRAQKGLRFGFIGSLDWLPNVEGVQWLLKHVWSAVAAAFPESTLHIAGKNMPENWRKIYANTPQLHLHGIVADAQTFIGAQDIMLIPLHSGGGMRIKAIEAMWLGKAVLTTKIGIEGIEGVPQTDFLVADTPADFIETMLECHRDTAKIDALAAAGQAFIAAHFDQKTIAETVLKAYKL